MDGRSRQPPEHAKHRDVMSRTHDRSVREFLERARRDPRLMRALRIAPAQTIANLRGLSRDTRHALLGIAREGGFAPSGVLSPVSKVALRAYVKTLSVRAGIDSLIACASDETIPKGQTGPLVYWRIVQIHDMRTQSPGEQQPEQPSDFTLAKGELGQVESGQVTLDGTGSGPYNREEVGYGWPEVIVRPPGVTASWPPGLYAIQFDTEANFDPTIKSFPPAIAHFLVRPRTLPYNGGSILLCFPFATTFAYAGGVAGEHVNTYNWDDAQRLRRVSIERPTDLMPFGDEREMTHHHPLRMWNFLQTHFPNATVDPCSSFDLHNSPIDPSLYQLFISVGHDEYWSKEMRDHVDAFVDAGGNAAFFSGNCCFSQVRLEDGGRTMVCYKNAVEDPLTGVDDARVTTMWASWPMERPENLTTGVGTRRGAYNDRESKEKYGITSNYQIVASDSILNGTGLAIGATIPFDLTHESDAADFTVDTGAGKARPPSPLQQGAYEVTGLDGTALNFKVVAVADLRHWQTPGFATLGYFSRNGTVFTVGNTRWAIGLDPKYADAAVQTITQNVVSWLSAKVHGSAYVPPPVRPKPPSDWALVPAIYDGDSTPTNTSTTIDAVAIAGVITGHLLEVDWFGQVKRRDPERPSGPEPTKIPPLPGPVLALVAPDHGQDLLCAVLARPAEETHLAVPLTVVGELSHKGGLVLKTAASSVLFERTSSTDSNAAWAPSFPTPGGGCCLGLAASDATDGFFIAVQEDSGRWLYKTPPIAFPANPQSDQMNTNAVRVGRWPDEFVALTGGIWEGKLYAASKSGELFTRESANKAAAVDLVWRKIGTVPVGTFALANYCGRLFALAGQPGSASLYWRPAVASAQFREPSLLFLDHIGHAMVGTLSSGGNFTRTGVSMPGVAFDLVSRADDAGLTFFFKNGNLTGTAVIGRFAQDGTFSVLNTMNRLRMAPSPTSSTYVVPRVDI